MSSAIVLLVLVAHSPLTTDAFFGSLNARIIAEYSAPIAIIAAGEVMLLICGEIDLSAGNVYAFSTWIFYFAVTDYHVPIWLAVIAGLLSGALVGLVNGLITVVVGVPSFITTLGMIFLLNGLTLVISGAFPVETPGGHQFFEIFGGHAYGTAYWGIGVIVVMAILLGRTRGDSTQSRPAATSSGRARAVSTCARSRSGTSSSAVRSRRSPGCSSRCGSPRSRPCRAGRR